MGIVCQKFTFNNNNNKKESQNYVFGTGLSLKSWMQIKKNLS